MSKKADSLWLHVAWVYHICTGICLALYTVLKHDVSSSKLQIFKNFKPMPRNMKHPVGDACSLLVLPRILKIPQLLVILLWGRRFEAFHLSQIDSGLSRASSTTFLFLPLFLPSLFFFPTLDRYVYRYIYTRACMHTYLQLLMPFQMEKLSSGFRVWYFCRENLTVLALET